MLLQERVDDDLHGAAVQLLAVVDIDGDGDDDTDDAGDDDTDADTGIELVA